MLRHSKPSLTRQDAFSAIIPHNGFRDTTRLFAALVLHRHGKRSLVRSGNFFHTQQRDARPNLRPRAHRRREANAIKPIIDRHSCSATNLDDILHKPADQRQRQKTVRDGRPIGRFSLRPLAIQMDPLPVFRSLRELRDAFLSDRKPIAHTNFLAHKLLQGIRRIHD